MLKSAGVDAHAICDLGSLNLREWLIDFAVHRSLGLLRIVSAATQPTEMCVVRARREESWLGTVPVIRVRRGLAPPNDESCPTNKTAAGFPVAVFRSSMMD